MTVRIKVLLWVTGVSFLTGTSLFWLAEGGINPDVQNLGDTIWWWVVTTTTVGYGDVVPVTGWGRVVTGFSVVAGFYVYANVVAVVAEAVHSSLEGGRRGTAQITLTGHIVLCDYTAIADELITSLRALDDWKDYPLVVVSDLVDARPYEDCHFVHGVPFSPEALRRSNVSEAKWVFIFANFRFADPDLKTLHVAARVLDFNPDATIFVEMVDPNSDLLDLSKGHLVPMDSRTLIEKVLRHQLIDPNEFLDKMTGST